MATINKDIVKHVHGFSRTLADLVIYRHQEKPFTSADEVIKYLDDTYERIKRNDHDIALLSFRTFEEILNISDVFVDGNLKCDVLYNHLLSYELVEDYFSITYNQCCLEKLYNVIIYFNRYRHYKSPEAIISDLKVCGLISNDELGRYSRFSCGFKFPLWIFEKFIDKRWAELAPDGKLDIRLLNELMFNRHKQDLENLGIATMISQKYHSFSSCHADVFYPDVVGYGPVYVKTGQSQYSRACGKGLFTLDHLYEISTSLFEQELYLKVLETDKGYEHIGHYYIPKFNWTLPVFHDYDGEMKFRNGLTKIVRILFIILTGGWFE